MPKGNTSKSSISPRQWRTPKVSRGLATVAALLLIGLVGVLAVGHFLSPTPQQANVGQATLGSLGGPFTLTDHNGRTVTDADFRGRYLLIYFGYIYCPDVCPLSLQRNFEALQILGEKAEKIQPVLVTIDPERDTVEKMRDYVAAFDPRLIGLTGTPEQVKAAAAAYRVYYAKVQNENGAAEGYLVDHSAFTYLMAPDGTFVQFFRHDMTPEAMAERLNKIL